MSSATAFDPLCGKCFRPIQAGTGGFILSCSDFICIKCINLTPSRCPACGKSGVNSLNLSDPLPEEVQSSISDPGKELKTMTNTLLFQVKYYKSTVKKMLSRLVKVENENVSFRRKLQEYEQGGPGLQPEPGFLDADVQQQQVHQQMPQVPPQRPRNPAQSFAYAAPGLPGPPRPASAQPRQGASRPSTGATYANTQMRPPTALPRGEYGESVLGKRFEGPSSTYHGAGQDSTPKRSYSEPRQDIEWGFGGGGNGSSGSGAPSVTPLASARPSSSYAGGPGGFQQEYSRPPSSGGRPTSSGGRPQSSGRGSAQSQYAPRSSQQQQQPQQQHFQQRQSTPSMPRPYTTGTSPNERQQGPISSHHFQQLPSRLRSPHLPVVRGKGDSKGLSPSAHPLMGVGVSLNQHDRIGSNSNQGLPAPLNSSALQELLEQASAHINFSN